MIDFLNSNRYPALETSPSAQATMTRTFDKRTMTKAETGSRAFGAWAKASAVCLIASPLIFFVWDLFESSSSQPTGSKSAQIGLFFTVAGIAAAVHFLAFLVIGLPLFLRFYSRPEFPLWRWLPGIITGTMIGIISVPLVLSVLYSRPPTEGLLQTAFAGGLYGSLTAIACLLNRPNVEQTGATNRLPAVS